MVFFFKDKETKSINIRKTSLQLRAENPIYFGVPYQKSGKIVIQYQCYQILNSHDRKPSAMELVSQIQNKEGKYKMLISSIHLSVQRSFQRCFDEPRMHFSTYKEV